MLFIFKDEKKYFYYVSGQTLEQIAEKGCEVLILGDIQKPTGHGPQQTALADPVLSWQLGLYDLQKSLLTSILFSFLLHYPSWCSYCISETSANFQVFTLPLTVTVTIPCTTKVLYSTVQKWDSLFRIIITKRWTTVVTGHQTPVQNIKLCHF